MSVLAQHSFLKLAATGGGSGAPYALLSGITVPAGTTYVVVALAGWSNGNDLTTPPTFGGVAMGLVGSVNGYNGALPRSRIWELALAPETWGTSLDLVVNDAAYNYVQYGRALFHDGGAARTPATVRLQDTAVSPRDLLLVLADAEAGDLALMAGTARNTANAEVVYDGNADETGILLHFPGVSDQFTIHGSYVPAAAAGQVIGQAGALTASSGGAVSWISYIAVAIPQPAGSQVAAAQAFTAVGTFAAAARARRAGAATFTAAATLGAVARVRRAAAAAFTGAATFVAVSARSALAAAASFAVLAASSALARVRRRAQLGLVGRAVFRTRVRAPARVHDAPPVAVAIVPAGSFASIVPASAPATCEPARAPAYLLE